MGSKNALQEEICWWKEVSLEELHPTLACSSPPSRQEKTKSKSELVFFHIAQLYLADGCSHYLISFPLFFFFFAPSLHRYCWKAHTQHLCLFPHQNKLRAIPMSKKHLYLRKNRRRLTVCSPFECRTVLSWSLCLSLVLVSPFWPISQQFSTSRSQPEVPAKKRSKGRLRIHRHFCLSFVCFQWLVTALLHGLYFLPFFCINSSSFSFGASTWGRQLGLGEGCEIGTFYVDCMKEMIFIARPAVMLGRLSSTVD